MKHRWRQSTQVRLIRVGWTIKKEWNERKLTFKVNYEVIKRQMIKAEKKNNPKRYDRLIHALRTDCIYVFKDHYITLLCNDNKSFDILIINFLCEFLWCEWSKWAKGKNNFKRWACNEKYICISALLYQKNSSNSEHSHVMFQCVRAEFGRRGRRRGRP